MHQRVKQYNLGNLEIRKNKILQANKYKSVPIFYTLLVITLTYHFYNFTQIIQYKDYLMGPPIITINQNTTVLNEHKLRPMCYEVQKINSLYCKLDSPLSNYKLNSVQIVIRNFDSRLKLNHTKHQIKLMYYRHELIYSENEYHLEQTDDQLVYSIPVNQFFKQEIFYNQLLFSFYNSKTALIIEDISFDDFEIVLEQKK